MKRRYLFLLVMSVFLAANLTAQDNFVYTNNDETGPNTVSVFAVGDDGVLTQVPGSPFLTGGRGGPGIQGRLFATNRIRVTGKFLYASNADPSSNNVSGFSIDPETGSLTPVPGSPFPTGGDGNWGISLAPTPNGQFLYAGNHGTSDITVFSIGPEGELTTVGNRVPAGDGVNGMKVSPDGRWLAVVLTYEGPHGSVAIFSIESKTGELTAVEGSPFPARDPEGADGNAAGVDINCASDRVFVGEGTCFLGGCTTIVDVLSIDPDTRVLTPIEGSPFMPGVGWNSNVPLLSPDDSLLFVSNTFGHSVTVFTVEQDGSLTLLSGSPFDTGKGGANGMAADPDGRFLYFTSGVQGPDSAVGVFTVDSGGALTLVPGSPFPEGRPESIMFSLAAYPPKTCTLNTR